MSVFTKLKDLISRNQNQPQYFLALNIDHNSVEACIWGVVEGQTKILGVGIEAYQGFDNVSFCTGQAIDQAGERTQADVSQTIFGLPEDWIDQDKVNEPYAHILKNLAKDLELEPLAFVSTPKAITHLLFQEELAPVNALIVGLSKETITAAVVTNGKIAVTKVAGRVTEELAGEIVKVIDSLQPGQALPSRIVLYGSVDLEKARDRLSVVHWSLLQEATPVSVDGSQISSAKFLHPPKIEVLEIGSQGKAVAMAGATDLGFSKPESLMGKAVLPAEKLETKPAVGTDFGFIQGRDILKEEKERQVEAAIVPPPSQKLGILGQAGAVFVNLVSRILENISLNFSARRNLILVPVLAIFFILVILFALYWFLPKAKVEIFVKSQPLSQEAEIIASPQLTSINEEKGQIPAQVLETSQKGSQKAVTSGKKLVGDKATGKVAVFNKTAALRNFNAGTILTSTTSNLKFVLDSSVTVASRSATLEGITYGKAQVNVTAAEIGTESNIATGQDFTVADFDQSLYSAHNDQAFSGGTSREVTVVAEEDLKKLEDSLTADLLAKAKADFSSKLPVNQKLLDQAIFKSIIAKNFDKKVGDETAVLTLNLEIKFKATAYNEEDLKKVLLGYIKINVPEGFEVVESQIQTEAAVSKVAENGDLIFDAKIKANLVPELNIAQIRKALVGKKPQAVEFYLAALPDVIGSQIRLTPPLPGPLAVMPRVANRIEIIVTPR